VIQKAELYLGLVVLAILGGWWFAAHEKAEGRREERESQAVALTHRLVDTVKKLDVRYQHDSIFTAKILTRYDTLKATLIVHDTAYIVKAVADSAVGACTSLLHSCDIRVALRDSVIAGLRLTLANAPKPPGFFAVWTPRVIAAGLGRASCSIK